MIVREGSVALLVALGRKTVVYGGGLSSGTVGGSRDVFGGGLMIPAALEILSSPSMRLFSTLIFSSNFLASTLAHLAMARNDFCFWFSNMRSWRTVLVGEVTNKEPKDFQERECLELSKSSLGSADEGCKSYFLRRISISDNT